MQNKGFHLAEVLIATTILAIVMTMAFPRIERFVDMGRRIQEKQKMENIQKALRHYALEKRQLPETTDDWWAELAPYTELTEKEIHEDVWGNERVYRRLKTPQVFNFKGGSYQVYHAMVYSYGDNGCMGTVDPCDMSDPSHVFGSDDFNTVSDFKTFNAFDGDFLVRYSDMADKQTMYNTSQHRLNKISEALSSYAERVYDEELAAHEYDPTRGVKRHQIPFPPNNIPVVGAAVPPGADLFTTTVIQDVQGVIDNGSGSRSVVYAGINDAYRRTSMISLMRFLGLPDEYCCDALMLSETDGKEKAFFYFSNPRRRLSNVSCAPSPTFGAPKLPPRLSRLPKEEACG